MKDGGRKGDRSLYRTLSIKVLGAKSPTLAKIKGVDLKYNKALSLS